MLLCAPILSAGPSFVALTFQIGGDGASDRAFRAEIRPNCSMNPRSLVAITGCLAGVCLAIALGFFSLGLWLVLPFAGLEIFALGWAVGYTIRRSADYEIITVDGDEVAVISCEGRNFHRETFQRYWVRIDLESGSTRLGSSRLTIGSHGRFIEIGRFGTDEAREELAARLRRALTNE